MHESSLIPNLLRAVECAARDADAGGVVRVSLTLGAFTMISPDHLRAHFVEAAAGTRAAGADLDITLHSEPTDPLAYVVGLQSLEVIGCAAEATNGGMPIAETAELPGPLGTTR